MNEADCKLQRQDTKAKLDLLRKVETPLVILSLLAGATFLTNPTVGPLRNYPGDVICLHDRNHKARGGVQHLKIFSA
jgi:hypothetical protein